MRWKTWHVVLIAVVFLTIGVAAGGAGKSKKKTTSTAATTTEVVIIPTTEAPTTTVPPSTTRPGPRTSFGPGTYQVGVDIAPGTYRTAGPSGSTSCYWARLRDLSGGGNNIIANDLQQGPTVAAIAASDAAFTTAGCQTWTKA
jgi:hypothetical protein